MNGSANELRTDQLVRGGFERVCCWKLSAERTLQLGGEAPKVAGVYAFAIDGIVQYVGVASASLAKRLYFYGRPGPGQTTNIRINALIVEALDKAQDVEVYVAVPPDLEWKGWVVNGAEGLEASLIKRFSLPWNKRGAPRPSAARAPLRSSGQSPLSQPVPTTRVAPAGDKYGPLREHLSRCTADKISMTFAEIQELVGPLPKSATLHRAWWANHEGNTQARGWMPARYIAEPNPAHRSVVFRRFSY